MLSANYNLDIIREALCIPPIKSHCPHQDWNTFLLRYNELDVCVSENETIKHGLNESTTPESLVVTSGQARSSTQTPLLLDDSGAINISVPITLTLDPQRPFGGYSRNITHLYATVLGQQVGLSGRWSLFVFVLVRCYLYVIVRHQGQSQLVTLCCLHTEAVS